VVQHRRRKLSRHCLANGIAQSSRHKSLRPCISQAIGNIERHERLIFDYQYDVTN
jgi:hypothetical protein